MRGQRRRHYRQAKARAIELNSTAEMILLALMALVAALVLPISAKCDGQKTLGDLVRELEENSPERARMSVSPLSLDGGSELTVIAPTNQNDLQSAVTLSLKSTHEELRGIFGSLPPITASVRLLDEVTFHQLTGAPSWTNALFYRGQIMIPLSMTEPPDFENISRAVRHEYCHAVIHALSRGRAPGWLDEGLAQWIEGEENPALKPALQDWLDQNPPVPLRLLQGGFTRLRNEMVPAAYAQSLFGATVLINTYGFSRIRRYMDLLRVGRNKDNAFSEAFGLSLKQFEERLGRTLYTWNNSSASESTVGIS